MDFAPEKSALEVDEARPSWLGGEGAGGEGAVEEADGEVLLPIVASEKDEPTLMHTIVEEAAHRLAAANRDKPGAGTSRDGRRNSA
jgi:hypothetical protein